MTSTQDSSTLIRHQSLRLLHIAVDYTDTRSSACVCVVCGLFLIPSSIRSAVRCSENSFTLRIALRTPPPFGAPLPHHNTPPPAEHGPPAIFRVVKPLLDTAKR